MAREPKLISLPVGKPVSLCKGAGFDSQWLGNITVRAICPRQDGLIDVFFCWAGDQPLSAEWIGRRRFVIRMKGDAGRPYTVSSLHERNTDEIKTIVLQPVS